MRKFLTSALAAVTFAGAVAATATPAAADSYRYYRHHHHGGDTAAAAIVAGVAGLALGSALSSSGGGYRSGGYYRESYPRSYYDRGYYSRGYYDDDYVYDYGYSRRPRVCINRERVWDPYIGRNVVIERRYPC